MEKKKRLSKITPKSIDKFNAFIANTPLVTYEDMVKKAFEMGHDPNDLIDAALGSVKYEKSSAKLEDPLEDILNAVYEKNPTPGKRYVIDPSEAISRKGKEVAKTLEGNLGIASTLNIGKSRSLPDYSAVKQQYDDLKKLQAIAHGGHELKHQEDYLVRPDVKMKTDEPFKKGHHFKGIYEPDELVREIKDLPEDEKTIKEILKQSKKSGLKPSVFTRLRSLLGPIGAGAGLYSALKSGDAKSAILEGASLIDPTGISDAAAEINRRLKMSPEEKEKTIKEDIYSAMPQEIAQEQRLLEELEDSKTKKYNSLREKLK